MLEMLTVIFLLGFYSVLCVQDTEICMIRKRDGRDGEWKERSLPGPDPQVPDLRKNERIQKLRGNVGASSGVRAGIGH